MSEELKACPFCGGNGRLYRRSAKYENAECDDFPDESDYPGCDYFIECDECDSASSVALTKREAIAAWNTRVDLPEQI